VTAAEIIDGENRDDDGHQDAHPERSAAGWIETLARSDGAAGQLSQRDGRGGDGDDYRHGAGAAAERIK
jgi:hypothetical protein